MGELYRQARARRGDSATDAQIVYLRRLVMEEDCVVDEDWLASLTRRQVSEEISRRTGERRIEDAD